MITKDAAARRLIQWHFRVEPELREVYRILLDDEESQEEPIRLLEVNAATVPTGSVEPFTSSPTKEIPRNSPPTFEDLMTRAAEYIKETAPPA